MIQKIKSFFLIATTTSIMAVAPAMVASGVAAAACTGNQNDVGAGASIALGQSASCVPTTSNSLASVAKTAVNVLSLIVGILAVIMIVYGGLRYITSGGDSGNVGNAKNTLLYAIIGLIIVALAQLIVHFVLNAAINSETTGAGGAAA